MQLSKSKPFLLLELAALMLGVPVMVWLVLPPRHIIPALLAMALLCYFLARRSDPTRATGSWNFAALTTANLKPMLVRFALCTLALAGATVLFRPELLFGFVKTKPLLWAMVMVLYPVFSVIAQEIVFRRYVFARYAGIFTSMQLILISGLGFGFAHLVLDNWVALLLSAIGGLIFASTYQRTRSLALVTLEHALYGNAVFTIGLGQYFYHGAVSS